MYIFGNDSRFGYSDNKISHVPALRVLRSIKFVPSGLSRAIYKINPPAKAYTDSNPAEGGTNFQSAMALTRNILSRVLADSPTDFICAVNIQ